MANKRPKITNPKLIIETSKLSKVTTRDPTGDKIFSNLFLTNSTHFHGSQMTPLPLSANSQKPGILEILLAKHIKTKNIESLKLNHRPKTVLNLKSKKEVDIKERPNEPKFENIIPLCVSNLEKKEKIMIEDYEIGLELGKGAYGKVRKAYHKLTNDAVAIKTYEKSQLLNPNRKKGVEREIKILNKVRHPNIVSFIKTIEDSETLNLVFEYISGCSLLEYLKSRSLKRLEEQQAKQIFKQIINALEFCHSIGVTHRDIKLENVLLDETHRIKLIDFGFSTYILNERKIHVFCGTSNYMAPEILMKKEYYGPPTDIWAAGVLLFVLVTGTFPFRAPQIKELYSKIQKGFYIVPPGLSSEIKGLFKKIFEIDPAKRPSAGKVLLDPWLCGENEKKPEFNDREFRF